MNKEIAEQVICNWISSMGDTRACSIRLADVRRLVTELVAKDRPSDESNCEYVCANR